MSLIEWVRSKFAENKKARDSTKRDEMDYMVLAIIVSSDKKLTSADIAEELFISRDSKEYPRIYNKLDNYHTKGVLRRRKLKRKIEDKRGVQYERKIWHYYLNPEWEPTEKSGIELEKFIREVKKVSSEAKDDILNVFKKSSGKLTVEDVASELNIPTDTKMYYKLNATLANYYQKGLLKRERWILKEKDKPQSMVESWLYCLPTPEFEEEGITPKKKKRLKTFVDTLEENIAGYDGPHSEIIQHAPEVFSLFQSLSEARELDSDSRQIVDSVVSYFVLPYDVIPEAEWGPFGYIDDLYLCGYVISELEGSKVENLVSRHWGGDKDIFKLAHWIVEEVEKSPVDSVKEALLEEVLERVNLRNKAVSDEKIEKIMEKQAPEAPEERTCLKCGKPLAPDTHPWTRYCGACAEEVCDTSEAIVTEIKKTLGKT